MMVIAAFSRRFPPTYKRRWYICFDTESEYYHIRYTIEPGVIARTREIDLNHALNVVESLTIVTQAKRGQEEVMFTLEFDVGYLQELFNAKSKRDT